LEVLLVVRYWHKANIHLTLPDVRFWADIRRPGLA